MLGRVKGREGSSRVWTGQKGSDRVQKCLEGYRRTKGSQESSGMVHKK
jgi:hypothetical protein